MAKKEDIFAALTGGERCITPSKLRGEAKEIWITFLAKYVNGDFTGVAAAELLAWAKEHVGLTCSPSCFRNALVVAKKAAK